MQARFSATAAFRGLSTPQYADLPPEWSTHLASDLSLGGRNNMLRLTFGLISALAAVLILMANTGALAQQSDESLAAAAQNPVAAMYSLPFQNNIYGGIGPRHDSTANVLNIQPVIPITVGDWNIISRTIAPL